MKNEANRLTPAELETAWAQCPWAAAAIGGEGTVRAINPAFTRVTGLAADSVLGLSEADFDAHFDAKVLEHRRVETAVGSLRAVHYFRDATAQSENELRLSNTAEVLREPLASIYGFAELLLTLNYDEATRRDLTSTLLEQVEVMSNLINHLLDVSKNGQADTRLEGMSLKRSSDPGDGE